MHVQEHHPGMVRSSDSSGEQHPAAESSGSGSNREQPSGGGSSSDKSRYVAAGTGASAVTVAVAALTVAVVCSQHGTEGARSCSSDVAVALPSQFFIGSSSCAAVRRQQSCLVQLP